MNAETPKPATNPRITLRTLRKWAREGEKFAMLTCYDATTARWLWRGGIRVLLVGDTAAEVVLGHDSTLPATMPFMLEITAGVRRGAPEALVMADMPFGSYQCGEDAAVANAMAFLTQGQADLVKLEVDATFASLVERMSHAGVPVVAHLGSRPQTVRAEGGYRAAGRTAREADRLVDTAKLMVQCGASALLVEAVPGEVGRRMVEAAVHPETGQAVPVIGCGAGPACHGHVVVLQDVLGMTDWHPPFVEPTGAVGEAVAAAAGKWVELVRSGEYLKDGGPYREKA
ncbi:MAG: 3-methyl-2-oxobutanoate hydroxymethyltransferase [Phycisphaeraceae bacterium]